jgi:hypothetical protein
MCSVGPFTAGNRRGAVSSGRRRAVAGAIATTIRRTAMIKQSIGGAALAAVLALAGPGSVAAHEGHTHKAMGTVTSVQGGQVEVKTTAGKTITVTLDGKTKVTRGKETLDAAVLKTGDRVSIDYVEEKKIMMARAVKLGTATARKK